MPRDCGTVLRFLPAGQPVSFREPRLQAAYEAHLAGDPMTLEHKQLRTLRLPVDGAYVTVVLAGFDSAADAPFDALRSVTAALGTALEEQGNPQVFLDGVDTLTFAPEGEILGQIAAVLPLCEYRFDRYLTGEKKPADHTVTVLAGPQAEDALAEGQVLARSVCIARDLVNEIAEVLTPAELARRAQALGQEWGFSVEVLDQAQCEALGMGLFLAVARGSALEPKFIVMRWNGGPAGQPPVGLVGKGITYDSGGLAIKSGSGMASMRFDMNGAAAVMGAMCAIAGRKLPRNVVGVVAACENMVDSRSYRNGDVLTSMSGKTVFVHNTDAEGRLTMADAITYCVRKEHPSEVVEVAGLTGSVCNFYGTVCAAALTTEDVLFRRLEGLMEVAGEKYARMPAFPEYRERLKSPYADLDNSPEGGCGGIVAGFFLDSFREDTPFLHIDFGALPFTSKKSDGQPEGATGFGVKTLYHYVKNRGDGQ